MTDVSNLPKALRKHGLFCLWKYERRGDKQTKVPYNPRTGGKAQPNNPQTFAPLTEAEAIQSGYDGLGVGIFGDICAIDIDHCFVDGRPTAAARDIMSLMDSYAEYSPSGSGIRILFCAPNFQYDKAKYYINNQKQGLEVYVGGATKKYVTVTGNKIVYRELMDRNAQLQKVLDRYMRRPHHPNKPHPASLDLSDNDILEKAANASNGAAFMALWTGDTSAYPSHSEADIALCDYLAFYTGHSEEQMDRLFRASGLMRDKWDRRQSGSTYGSVTIQNAIRSCRAVYNPSIAQHKKSGAQQNEVDAKGISGRYKPTDYTDTGNAKLFARECKDIAIYVKSIGWLVWDGKVWIDNDLEAKRLAIQLTENMLKEARAEYRTAEKTPVADDGSKDKLAAAKKFHRHAENSRNSNKIEGMLSLARSLMQMQSDTLDAHPYVLNTPAGMVDLQTGDIKPHDAQLYCTKITKCSPGTKGADVWNTFLDTITDGERERIEFFQQALGMAAVGKVYEENLLLAVSPGGTAKSTIFNSIAAVFNDYSGSIAADTLTTAYRSKGAELATLKGKRLIIAAELEEGARLSASMLKQITSTDKIRGERKYKDPEDFTPSHTTILYTNHLPHVGSTDTGTWRRLVVVPFEVTIAPDKEIKNYADVLVNEAGEALLSWVIEGAKQFIANGHKLPKPRFVVDAVEKYRAENDWLGDFLADRCEVGQGLTIGAMMLLKEYRQHAEATGAFVRDKKDFKAEMEKRGFESRKSNTGTTWYGLALRSDFVPTGAVTPFERAG